MHHDLLTWGQSLNYPSIVLCRMPKDILQAGRDAWQLLLESGNSERIARLQERWQYWQTKHERTSNLV